MKKMKFVLPAIFGLAIVTGLLALLLAAISKILIVAGIAGVVITLAKRRFARKQQYGMQGSQQYNMYGAQGFGQMNAGQFNFQGNNPFNQNNVTPISNGKRSTGIIPIN